MNLAENRPNRSHAHGRRHALIRLAQIMRGWSTYFRHAVSKHTFSALAHFVWHRVARWLMTRHHWKWSDLRRRFTSPSGRWIPLSADGTVLFNLEAVPVTRYRYRGNIATPWAQSPT
ncbi:MAG TPA: group II intron maturase-specific domain-containing protein [Actinomycetota bacterium]|nr:group II intron maturase-specific domain-containing protein [Actinomycetota bacterium]